ncbi:MAG TPA: hypothetical protein VEK76_00955 [Candidatus Binatia bacterium]|nr:hypothetical protein [Candidatus Binatia bacterium]
MRPVPAQRVAHLYRQHLDPRRERLFLSSAAFFTAFAATRGITHAIRRRIGPFRNVSVGGHHVHHLVIGIAGLLGTGYLWLIQVGTGENGDGSDPTPGSGAGDALSKLTSVMYGAASAVTLDEFALWLNLKDVYWARQGRESVDAVVLFGAALSVGLWGGPFFRAVYHEARRLA